MKQTTPLHRYRAHLIPHGMPADEVEQAAATNSLPYHQLHAKNADAAREMAQHTSGLPVHSVDRVDDSAPIITTDCFGTDLVTGEKFKVRTGLGCTAFAYGGEQ